MTYNAILVIVTSEIIANVREKVNAVLTIFQLVASHPLPVIGIALSCNTINDGSVTKIYL